LILPSWQPFKWLVVVVLVFVVVVVAAAVVAAVAVVDVAPAFAVLWLLWHPRKVAHTTNAQQ